MKRLLLLVAICISFISFGQIKEIYPNVKICKQTWFSENLRNSLFSNGDTILLAQNMDEWLEAAIQKKTAYCYYNFDPTNGEKYGFIYNGFAVLDPRGLAPQGWRIPKPKDWNKLIKTTGGKYKCGTKLKNDSLWRDDYGSENKYGFSALPGGMLSTYFDDTGNFVGWHQDILERCAYWSYDFEEISMWNGYQSSSTTIWYLFNDGQFLSDWEDVEAGHYVRCIKR